MGADSVLMGTRFLATQESGFHAMWKQEIVDTGDSATLVARGFVGPARWLKTPRSQKRARNTLQKSPGGFLGTPEDYSTADTLTNFEVESIKATFEGNRGKAMMAAGEAAQRIKDMPKVNDLVQEIMTEAEATLREVPRKVLA
jgi:NAD(P)H-dependent flavin oxidoreductase YrpB (nitropropane dioxygenase family)